MPIIQGGTIIEDVAPATRMLNVTITSAELLALNATPIELVPAPGADEFIDVQSIVVHKPAGTAYAGIASGEDLTFNYTDESGLAVAGCETTGFLDSTAAQTRLVRPTNVTSITPTLAAALVAHLLVGEIITGDSDLNIQVEYKIRKSVIS